MLPKDVQNGSHRTDELSRIRLTRKDVIDLIERNGGPFGLDLSKYDLSGADLARLNLRGIIFGVETFSGHAYGANLSGVSFTDSDLTNANLAHTDLTRAELWQTNLHEAALFGAIATDAYFGKTDLSDADLYTCHLNGANLWQTNLSGANLFAAQLTNATLSDINLGKSLLQESEYSYRQYFQRWYVGSLDKKYVARHVQHRQREAAEIYRVLKNAYMASGCYAEASEAYIRERRLRRMMLAPWRAKTYYPDKFDGKIFKSMWSYVSTTTRWILDWCAEVISGYGERPLRPIGLAVFVVMLFSVLQYLAGGVISDAGTMNWIDYLNYSLAAFTSVSFDSFHTTTTLAQTLTSIEAMLGVSLLALLMFVLGNRISRS